jgi:purine-nucleoside phosphorylase
MWEKIQQTANFLKERTSYMPDFGVILGSGLGSFPDQMIVDHVIPYADIPNFPEVTVKGHQGALVFGTIAGKQVVAMQGRFHYYEGYDMNIVTFPVRVMKFLGVKYLIVSNASGGVNPKYKVGDLILINDHINCFPEHPLRGVNDDRLGPRFVNMSEPYAKDSIQKLLKIGQLLSIPLQQGVYLGLQGPTFETLAEYGMVRRMGADCVGMSTVPEVIVARHMDMTCIGISVITDMGIPEFVQTVNHDEVLQAAKVAEPKVKLLIKTFIEFHQE